MFLIVPCLSTDSFNGIKGDADGLIAVENIDEMLTSAKSGSKWSMPTRRRIIPDTSAVELTQNDAEFDYEIIDVLLSTNDVDEEIAEILSDEEEPFVIRPYDEYDLLADEHGVDFILDNEGEIPSFYSGVDFDSYEDDYIADELQSMTVDSIASNDVMVEDMTESRPKADPLDTVAEQEEYLFSLYRPKTRHRIAEDPENMSILCQSRKDRSAGSFVWRKNKIRHRHNKVTGELTRREYLRSCGHLPWKYSTKARAQYLRH